ncbi:VWA domain-containing protein [Vibrio aquaticus]|uniref:VWA domain-containing protein n=2 Tax=Vibrio aquaticus TaxID=2496559 RepID=A0A3S0MNI5_9VIBR|nr:VWA domain-containing protein [Vibrio aquaticus]
MKQHSLRKQGGHAALLFALIIPAMWGFFTLAIDGSRAIQTKARLGDAAEVAALALAAQNSLDQVENRALATNYIDAYVSDVDITVTSIERTECNVSNSRDCDGASRYAQYALDVSIEQQSWLPTESWAGFGESYDVVHEATARKYQGDSIDVAFVMDYSGSMREGWNRKAKYQHVEEIINEVLDELESYQGIQEINNRVALVPYAEFTARPDDNMRCDRWGTRPWHFVDQLYFKSTWSGLKVDAKTTVRNWRYDRATDPSMVCDGSNYNNHYVGFKTVPFADDFTNLRSVMSGFYPDGATASYQGIIKAAQLFERLAEPNPRQLLVILSDGDDSTGYYGPLRSIPTQSLIEEGLCDVIKSELSSRQTPDNRPVTFQFAMIGFDYDVNDNPLTQCVGKENVYDAKNPDELLDIILNLISEEIGHLK